MTCFSYQIQHKTLIKEKNQSNKCAMHCVCEKYIFIYLHLSNLIQIHVKLNSGQHYISSEKLKVLFGRKVQDQE